MRFTDTGEKIKYLRKKLNIIQEELNAAGVSRNFISMIENGKRKLPQNVASNLMRIFNEKASKLGVKLDVDENWLMTTAKEHAVSFCNEKLKNGLKNEDIDTVAEIVKDYDITEFVPAVYTAKADMLYNNQLYEEAFTYYYNILDHLKDDKGKEAFIYNKLGKCKIKMLNYIEAITYFNKCYNISLKDNNENNKKNCLYNMAYSYSELGNNEIALECINEFIELCDIDRDFVDYISAVIVKGNCYIDLKRYQLAINLLTSSIDKFADTNNKLLGYIYNSLGAVYIDINNLDIASEYLDKAYHIREISDIYNLPRTIYNKAEIFLKKGDTENAVELINNAINLSENNGDYEYTTKLNKYLEEIYLNRLKNENLKNIYLKQIDLYNILKNEKELFKTYIKLLNQISDSHDTDEYKLYLNNALKQM